MDSLRQNCKLSKPKHEIPSKKHPHPPTHPNSWVYFLDTLDTLDSRCWAIIICDRKKWKVNLCFSAWENGRLSDSKMSTIASTFSLTMMRTSGEKKLRARGEKTEGPKSFSPYASEIHEDTKSFSPLTWTIMDKISDCPSPSLHLPKRSNHTHHNTRIIDYII